MPGFGTLDADFGDWILLAVGAALILVGSFVAGYATARANER
jgi:hypothetical protein